MKGLDFEPETLLCFPQLICFAFSNKSATQCTVSDTCNPLELMCPQAQARSHRAPAGRKKYRSKAF
jgi:hypothetical protein